MSIYKVMASTYDVLLSNTMWSYQYNYCVFSTIHAVVKYIYGVVKLIHRTVKCMYGVVKVMYV